MKQDSYWKFNYVSGIPINCKRQQLSIFILINERKAIKVICNYYCNAVRTTWCVYQQHSKECK